MQRAADYFGVTPHVRLGERVVESKWNDKTHLWTVKTDKGNSYTANFVLGGTGALHKPMIPDFKGLFCKLRVVGDTSQQLAELCLSVIQAKKPLESTISLL